MANLSVCASVILEGVETTSGVSSSVYLLRKMVTNDLTLVFTEGSSTRGTEDRQSPWVGSVKNSTKNCMLYSCLPALYDLFSGSYLYAFSLGLHLLPTCPLWIHPIHLLGIDTSFIPHTTLWVRGDKLVCKRSRYLRPILSTVCLQASVTLCAVVRFTCFDLHKVREGLPSYILRTGPGRTDGRYVYGVVRWVPLSVVFHVGWLLPRPPVMTRRPNAGAGGGCYLFSSKFVCVKVGQLCHVNPYGESVRLTRAPLFQVFVPNTLYLLYNLSSISSST